ncbi:hypothetical protein PoB_005526200 [Plakobranchus ocellatus]|uniref:Uncharacterized protein n=1 Tax=Plakobranchus ocellatus TaxID=259542 RepID=A0AAV4CC41_9GAST|nr:hypothetical protein PoB_005526200 [Plakobranchus ocellatus]
MLLQGAVSGGEGVGCMYIGWPQHGDLRFSGPPSGQGASSGARNRNRRVPADFRADSLSTVPPTPPEKKQTKKKRCEPIKENGRVWRLETP